jgi:hypothetical protein
MNVVPLDQLSFSTFAGLVKTKWRVLSGTGDAFDLELAAVTPQRFTQAGPAGGLVNEQFTLVLLGPADRLLPQRIYAFEAPSLGRFELFIVPVGRDAAGIRYEAAFNRTRPAR